LKTRYIPKTTSSKKASTQSVKMSKQKFEFKYKRKDFLSFVTVVLLFVVSYLILQGLINIFTEASSDVRMTFENVPIIGSFLVAFIYGCLPSSIIPQPSSYAILHETYLELQLYKVLHIIKYQEIECVTSIAASGGGKILIIALKGKRDIRLGMIHGFSKNSTRYKESYLPLSELKKALKKKMEDINQN